MYKKNTRISENDVPIFYIIYVLHWLIGKRLYGDIE